MVDSLVYVSLLWRDGQRRPWRVEFRHDMSRDGKVLHTGISLTSEQGQGVTAAVVRSLADALPALVAEDTAKVVEGLKERGRAVTQATRTSPGPSRKRHTNEVAAVYKRAEAAGGHPMRAVEEHFGIKRTIAAREVKRARDEGLLPPKEG
jgi:hypothetical protein